MNLTLVDAFSRFGATPISRLRSLSAIALDGAVVLNCSQQYFGHPSAGVLRYEDRLSRASPRAPKETALLGEHLSLARDGDLPVRMIVAIVADSGKKTGYGYHVRPDLVGKVVKFDGDHFMIDFARREEVSPTAVAGRRR
jgi:hypothetical protein